jgi:hypothetical protein
VNAVHVGRARDLDDGDIVVRRVLHLHRMGTNCHGSEPHPGNRLPVRHGTDQLGHPDRAAGARHVEDDNRLAENRFGLFRQHAEKSVRPSTRRSRHNQPEGIGG